MFVLVFAVLAVAANIPHLVARPEKAFLRLLGRFFRSCEYLMTTMRWNITMTPTRLDHWRKAFHEREVATLPQKLAAWGKAVDTKALPGTTSEQVQELTTNLQALAYRMQEQLEARESRQATFLVRELLEDVRTWRLKVQEVFRGWSRDPANPPLDALRERLAARLDHLEGRIEETLDKAAEGELTEQDSERLYRLLGSYRGLSEAGLEYARTAGGIEWSRWRESRF
jgi:DNA anti-recombination protein RmuC